MPNYRRPKIPGRSFFFTVVTYRRRRLLHLPESRQALREVFSKVRRRHPFNIEAWVLLPEHLHCIWTLPVGDSNFSARWALIKAGFSKRTRSLFHVEEWLNESKVKHRESTIWQRRFWDHKIRSDEEYQAYMDYIHYNPVKHGYVLRAVDWPHSTFHRYVRKESTLSAGVAGVSKPRNYSLASEKPARRARRPGAARSCHRLKCATRASLRRRGWWARWNLCPPFYGCRQAKFLEQKKSFLFRLQRQGNRETEIS